MRPPISHVSPSTTTVPLWVSAVGKPGASVVSATVCQVPASTS